MESPTGSENLKNWWALGVAVFLLALAQSLPQLDLRFEEPRRALVAMEMDITQQYAVPMLHGQPYYNKPPLFNWAIIAAKSLTGSFDEWVVRLPSLLAFLATAMLLFTWTRRHLGQQTAIWATVFYATSSDLFLLATVFSGEIDLFFSFIVFAQAAAMFNLSSQGRWLAFFAVSYFLAGLGFLTKGLPALVFQGLTLLVVLWTRRRMLLLFHWKHLAGLGVLAAVIGHYFWWYSQSLDPTPFIANLFKESASRTAAHHGLGELLAHLVSFPFEMLLLRLMPWSLLVVFLFSKGFRARLHFNPALRFAALFLLVNLLPYWLSPGTRVRYLYMFFPFAAVLLAYFFLQNQHLFPRWNKALRVGFGALILAFSLGWFVVPFLPQAQVIPNVGTLSFTFGLVGLAIFVAYRKDRNGTFLWTAVFLLALRLGLNSVYWPISDKHVSDWQSLARVSEHTRGAGVRWTGEPQRFTADFSLGPIPSIVPPAQVSTPPFLPFWYTYYLTLETGKIVSYDSIPLPGHFYLCPADAPQASGQAILTQVQHNILFKTRP